MIVRNYCLILLLLLLLIGASPQSIIIKEMCELLRNGRNLELLTVPPEGGRVRVQGTCECSLRVILEVWCKLDELTDLHYTIRSCVVPEVVEMEDEYKR